jgi:hypothetical protein
VGSFETSEKFANRAITGQLTKDDFKHFSACLCYEETPTALADLTPTDVSDTQPHGVEGRYAIYSFSDHDAATISQRWHSGEEKGMYSIANHTEHSVLVSHCVTINFDPS